MQRFRRFYSFLISERKLENAARVLARVAAEEQERLVRLFSFVSPTRNAKSAVVVVPASTEAGRTMRWNPETFTLTSYSPAKRERKP